MTLHMSPAAKLPAQRQQARICGAFYECYSLTEASSTLQECHSLTEASSTSAYNSVVRQMLHREDSMLAVKDSLTHIIILDSFFTSPLPFYPRLWGPNHPLLQLRGQELRIMLLHQPLLRSSAHPAHVRVHRHWVPARMGLSSEA